MSEKISQLENSDKKVRQSAAEALGSERTKASLRALLDAAKNDNEKNVRKAAIEAIRKLNDPEAVPVLENIQNDGANYFYKGQFAKKAVSVIQKYGGTIKYEDFANYKTIIKQPLFIDYKGYKIFSAPPPQSGLTLLEILNIIENIPQKKLSKQWMI